MTHPPSGQYPAQQPGEAGQPTDIRQFAPRRNTEALLWTLVVSLIGIGIVLGGLYARFGAPAPEPAPEPTPTQSVPAGPGLPFEMPQDPANNGRWEILDEVWENDGVSLQISVSADSGQISYGFAAFSNNGQESVLPEPGTRDPELDRGNLSAGETVTGWIFLPLPREDATILLTTAQGWQISALGVKG